MENTEKQPTDFQQMMTSIETKLFSAYLVGKENDSSFTDWEKRNDVMKNISAQIQDYFSKQIDKAFRF